MVSRPFKGWDEVGRRVAAARESAGLTQQKLADRIGVDRTALVKIESGKRGISSLELAQLAAELRRPLDWFVAEAPPAVVSRRAAALEPAEDLDVVVDALARDIEILIELASLRLRGSRTARKLPTTLAEAEERAAATRAEIGQPSGPMTNLLAKVDSVGLHALAI